MKIDSSNFGPIIRCPKCKAEYLAGEIFLPSDHIGKIKNVIKDPLNKILYADYEEDYAPNSPEEFTCEFCNTSFIVETSTTYKVKAQDEALNFGSTETSLI